MDNKRALDHDLRRPLPSGWQWAKLGEMCEQDRQIVEPRSNKSLNIPYLGLEHIESGTGKILKETLSSSEDIGISTTFAFNERHVLYGKLRPYLNKVALPKFRGRCTTEIIPLLPTKEVNKIFLGWLLRRRETVEAAMLEKTGSRMPRADMDELMKLPVPLPPLIEQKRIASLLNEQMEAVEKARAAAEAQLEAAKALPGAYLRQVFPKPGQELLSGWRWVKLGEVCELNPHRTMLERSDSVLTTFVPMSAVDAREGKITKAEPRPYGEVKKGYTYFCEGDVLFAKITPCMQNGKHAIATKLIDGIGFGSTEFHVIRPVKEIYSEWIHFFMRQENVLLAATAHFTGAVGQQRVPEEYLANLPIPLPPLAEQKRIVAELFERMSLVEKFKQSIEYQLNEINALPASLLRRAFSGGL